MCDSAYVPDAVPVLSTHHLNSQDAQVISLTFQSRDLNPPLTRSQCMLSDAASLPPFADQVSVLFHPSVPSPKSAIWMTNQLRFWDMWSILMKLVENPIKEYHCHILEWNTTTASGFQETKSYWLNWRTYPRESTAYQFTEFKKVEVANPNALRTLVFQTSWLVLWKAELLNILIVSDESEIQNHIHVT